MISTVASKVRWADRTRRAPLVALGTVVLAVMVALLVVLLTSGTAHAATTFTVDRTDDPDPTSVGACTAAPNDCSLREAIVAANDAAGEDAITVPAGTYTLTRPIGEGSDNASLGDLDIETDELTITGAGARATRVVGGAAPFDDRIFHIHPDATATITGLTITGGKTAAGSAAYNQGGLTLDEVAVRNNGSTDSVGGGVYSEGTLNVTDTTVSGNSAGDSGGILQEGATANITNSTISGNQTAQFVGGVAATSGAVMNIVNSTIASNTSPRLGGGILAGGPGTLIIVRNTIVASNTVDNCDTAQAAGGIISSKGNNISTDDSCPFTKPTDKQNTNPKLGPLANNGGPTNTRALLAGSPAIDAGANTTCPARDQRGVVRKDGDGNGTVTCDIGAFEAATNTKPTISALKPAPGSKTRDNTPLISAKVSDAQTDLAKANIKLFVDGKAKSFSYNASTDRLVYQSTKLKVGTHKVKVVAIDSHKASSTKIWGFKVVKKKR